MNKLLRRCIPIKNAKYTSSVKYHCLEYLKRNSVELYLNYCGKEYCEPGHHYGPAKRTEFLLHYILDGSGTFTCSNKTYTLHKNDAFLIMPDEITSYCADSETPWTYVWIGFNGSKASDCLRYAGFSYESRIQSFPNSEFIKQCIDNILEAHQLTYAHDLIRQSNLMLLLSSMIQIHQETHPKQNEENEYPQQVYIEYATDFIERHIHENIKVSDIASFIGIDRSYLTKIFKKMLDLSPQEYLINLRMNKASSLLKTTDYTISQIAEEVGYNSTLSFTKAFKLKYNISPGAYRTQSETTILASHKEMPH